MQHIQQTSQLIFDIARSMFNCIAIAPSFAWEWTNKSVLRSLHEGQFGLKAEVRSLLLCSFNIFSLTSVMRNKAAARRLWKSCSCIFNYQHGLRLQVLHNLLVEHRMGRTRLNARNFRKVVTKAVLLCQVLHWFAK